MQNEGQNPPTAGISIGQYELGRTPEYRIGPVTENGRAEGVLTNNTVRP